MPSCPPESICPKKRRVRVSFDHNIECLGPARLDFTIPLDFLVCEPIHALFLFKLIELSFYHNGKTSDENVAEH